jgi:tetratricopeptide (TPR) repeat protein
MEIWSSEIKELEKLYNSFKGHFPDLEKEMEQLIRTEDANVIMLYSRRCLEVIITDLCECELRRPRKTEPLHGIIDKLHKEEKVPSHIIASMHGLNELSTYGAHPKDFDPEQVKPVLNNLATIIKWYLKYKDAKLLGKAESEQEKFVGRHADIPVEVTSKSKKNLTLILTSILLIVAVIAFPKIFKQDKLANMRSSDGRISVAVMPFQNMTNDSVWNVWQNGIQDILVTFLSNSSEELKVRQTESTNALIESEGFMNYSSFTPSLASDISQKLDANVFIYGGIKQAGARLRVNAQLIDSKTEESIKSFEIDGPASENMIFQIIDSLKLMVKNYLVISRLERELPVGYTYYASTNSPEAFRYYTYGLKAFYKKDFLTAIKFLSHSIAIDSTFITAYFSLGTSYGNQGMLEEAAKLVLKFYDKRDQLPIQLKTKLEQCYAYCFETPFEEIKCLKQLQEFDDQEPRNYYNLGEAYTRINQYDEAIPEFEKALEIYNKWDSKPLWAPNYTMLGLAYHKTGQYKKEQKLYRQAERDFPDDNDLVYRQAVLSFYEGDEIAASGYIEKLKTILKENASSEPGIITNLAMIYSEAGILDLAEQYFRQALSMEPEKPVRLNNLAWFLINNDRNINEGLDLVEKALELTPDNYIFLHTKGWGLYKQGKYQEAYDILQKSWDIRRQREGYEHIAYLHLEEAKKAVAGQKKN